MATVTGDADDMGKLCVNSTTGRFVDSRPSMWSGMYFPQLEPASLGRRLLVAFLFTCPSSQSSTNSLPCTYDTDMIRDPKFRGGAVSPLVLSNLL